MHLKAVLKASLIKHIMQNRHVREKRKTAVVRRVSPVGGKVEKLWRKGLVEKMSFEPGVQVRRSNGW